MKSPKREIYIRKVLDAWNDDRNFTAEQFACAYNTRYSHYSIPASGFYTYFLRFEKEGIMQIIRGEDGRKLKYIKIFPTGVIDNGEMGG